MVSLRSKITGQVLEYFFLNPNARPYVNELARIFHADPKNLHKKLVELEREKILESEYSGQQRYFSLNRKHPLLKEYRGIVLKTLFEKRLTGMLETTPGISAAYLFGSYAKQKMDAASDIDILVIGEHSSLGLQKKVNLLQRELGREINTVNMDPREFDLRKKRGDSFLANVLSDAHIRLI